MEQTISGIFMKNVVDEISRLRGENGLAQLKRKIGLNHFAAFRNYPMELDVKLAKAACEILYGDDSPQSYINLGKLTFQKYTESVVGKTMEALTGTDFRKAALVLERVFQTFSHGLSIKSKETDQNNIIITMDNIPYNIHHFEGLWRGALEHYKLNGTVTCDKLKENCFQYTIKLESQT
jgi:uncharacterized protein (TIGR02265 family)